jgi:uncharacterized protein YqhQ
LIFILGQISVEEILKQLVEKNQHSDRIDKKKKKKNKEKGKAKQIPSKLMCSVLEVSTFLSFFYCNALFLNRCMCLQKVTVN